MTTEKTVGEKLEQAKAGLRVAILRVALTSYAEFFPSYLAERSDEKCAGKLRDTYATALRLTGEQTDIMPESRVSKILREDQIAREQKLKEKIKAEMHDLKFIHELLTSQKVSTESPLSQEVATCSIEIKKFLRVLLIALQASRLEYIWSVHELLVAKEEKTKYYEIMSCKNAHKNEESNVVSEFLCDFPTVKSIAKIRKAAQTLEESKKAQEVTELLFHLQALTVGSDSISDESLEKLVRNHPVLVEPAVTFLTFKNSGAQSTAVYLTREEGINKLEKVAANTPWLFQLLIGYQLSKIKEKIYKSEDSTMTSQLLKHYIEKMKKRKFLFVSYDSILDCACCQVIRQLLAELCQPHHSPVVRQAVTDTIKNLPQHHRGTSARAASR